MANTTITRELIDKVVNSLPSKYQPQLAKTCFGRASKSNVRKIKHWRSGLMADKVLERKIFVTAKALAKKHQEVAA